MGKGNRNDENQRHKLMKEKVLIAPVKKGRKTPLNPNEETQTRSISGHEVRFTNLSKSFGQKKNTPRGTRSITTTRWHLSCFPNEGSSADSEPSSPRYRRKVILSKRCQRQSTRLDRDLSLLQLYGSTGQGVFGLHRRSKPAFTLPPWGVSK